MEFYRSHSNRRRNKPAIIQARCDDSPLFPSSRPLPLDSQPSVHLPSPFIYQSAGLLFPTGTFSAPYLNYHFKHTIKFKMTIFIPDHHSSPQHFVGLARWYFAWIDFFGVSQDFSKLFSSHRPPLWNCPASELPTLGPSSCSGKNALKWFFLIFWMMMIMPDVSVSSFLAELAVNLWSLQERTKW